jgi:hypothetical protein
MSTITTKDIDRVIPTPLGFIQPGMTVVDGTLARLAHLRATRTKRPRHEAITTYKVVDVARVVNRYGDHIWTFTFEHADGTQSPCMASGFPHETFAGHVVVDR